MITQTGCYRKIKEAVSHKTRKKKVLLVKSKDMSLVLIVKSDNVNSFNYADIWNLKRIKKYYSIFSFTIVFC